MTQDEIKGATTALLLVEMSIDEKMAALMRVDGDLCLIDFGAINALRYVKDKIHYFSVPYKLNQKQNIMTAIDYQKKVAEHDTRRNEVKIAHLERLNAIQRECSDAIREACDRKAAALNEESRRYTAELNELFAEFARVKELYRRELAEAEAAAETEKGEAQ